MDYTLAIYDQPAMDDLSIRATIDKLIKRGYPDFIKTVPVSTQFPVRGLLIDKRFGHVLKMDRYKHVHKGYHGFRELTKEELRALYHSKKIRPATPALPLDRHALRAAARSRPTRRSSMRWRRRATRSTTRKLFTDIRECIDEAHRDGTILDEVVSNLPHFVHRDPNLAPTLHKLRSAGKKLFLLTNSRAAYTEKMMTYLLGGAMTEYPKWQNFFDVVIVAATKPIFFTERRPLLERDGETTRPAQPPLERGKIYEGGNLQDVERALGATGDEVLYVGDHIYGDILRSKKDSAWRTAMIIQELETEIAAYESCNEDFEGHRDARGAARAPRGRAPLLPGAHQGADAADRARAGPRARAPTRARATSRRAAAATAAERDRARTDRAPSSRPNACASSAPSSACAASSARSTPRSRPSSGASICASTRTGARCSRKAPSSRASASRSTTTRACTPHASRTSSRTRRSRPSAARAT